MDSLKKLSDPNLSKFNLAAETSGVELSASAKAFLDGEVCYTGVSF